MLNVANIRDYASAEELIILVNMESQNAELIKAGLTQNERFEKLREMARTQMQVLLKNRAKETLKNTNPNLSIERFNRLIFLLILQ
ncbi:hypothetical protein [Eshraghiella crossota]|uniref:hypothetical protein n=1 Tax=Eshraghiella crossota TaxID=45851 RepID=UPI003AB7C490